MDEILRLLRERPNSRITFESCEMSDSVSFKIVVIKDQGTHNEKKWSMERHVSNCCLHGNVKVIDWELARCVNVILKVTEATNE